MQRSRRLPAEVELALFRIAQEALYNVERHSGASHVTVSLDHRPEKSKLVVSDNGKGFSASMGLSELGNENKLGLMGMHKRARIVGGSLVIRSAPGAGTTVIAELPVPRKASTPASRKGP